MKILYVTSYPLEYDTSANIRNMSLIQGFVDNGHQVSTLSPYPSDVSLFSGKMLEFPFEKRYWIGTKSTIIIDHTKKSLMSRMKRLVSKLVSDFSVYDRRALMTRHVKGGIIHENYDVIVSSSDPKSSHIIAEKLIKTNTDRHGRWIQYWGDPFTCDISNSHRFSLKRIQKEERRLISLAQKVVYVSPFTLEYIKERYPEYADKMVFYPIPFVGNGRMATVRTDVNLVGYLGDYSSKNRNILPFVQAVKDLKVKTSIAGTSDLTIESTETLTVYGRLQGEAFDELAARVGVYVCVCNRYGTQIPGKVYHYADTGKPILIILDGDNEQKLRAYFEEFKRFYLCRNTVNEISFMIKKILSEHRHFNTPEILQAKGIAYKFVE